MGFPGGSVVKNLPINVGDLGWIPGEGNGNPLHYSCLGNPIDRGAWWATVYRVTKSLGSFQNYKFTSLNSGKYDS